MEIIDTIFYYAKTLQEYTEALLENKVLSRTIVFVDENQSIYKDGKIFGSYKKAVELIDQLSDEVRSAMDESERELTSLINRLRETVWNSFLEEMQTVSANLEEYKNKLDRLRAEFDGQVIEVGDAFQTIDSLNGIIELYASWKTSVEGTLTTFRSVIDALNATIIRLGERLDVINNQVTNFLELIDLLNLVFRQYMENYDITEKVRNIIGREILLSNGVLHDFATLTDVDDRFRNSIDVWFNSLLPSWTQLTSKVNDTYIAMSGFDSRIDSVESDVEGMGGEIGSIKARATLFASWLTNYGDAVAALVTAAGNDSSYFDLMAKFTNLSDADAKTMAARIFGFANAEGSRLILSSDLISLDTGLVRVGGNVIGLGDWIMGNVTVNKLAAGTAPNQILINSTDGIKHAGGNFQIRPDGSGYFGNSSTKISWTSNGQITLTGLTVSGGGSASSGGGTDYAYLTSSGILFSSGNNTVQLTNQGLFHTTTGQTYGGFNLNIDGSGYIARHNIYWDAAGNINIGGSVTINGVTIDGTSTWGGYHPSDFYTKTELGTITGTLSSYIDNKIAQAQLGGSSLTEAIDTYVAGLVSTYIDNEITLTNGKLHDYIKTSDLNTTLSAYVLKTGLATDLDAVFYDSNGNITGSTRLANALSLTKTLAGYLLDNQGHLTGVVTSNEFSSKVLNFLDNNSAYSGLLTWASSVMGSTTAAGFSLQALASALIGSTVTEAQCKASITGLVDTNTLKSSLTLSADNIILDANNTTFINAVGNLITAKQLLVEDTRGNTVAQITPDGRIYLNNNRIYIPTVTRSMNGSYNGDSNGIIIKSQYKDSVMTYYQGESILIQSTGGDPFASFSSDKKGKLHLLSYGALRNIDMAFDSGDNNSNIPTIHIDYSGSYVSGAILNVPRMDISTNYTVKCDDLKCTNIKFHSDFSSYHYIYGSSSGSSGAYLKLDSSNVNVNAPSQISTSSASVQITTAASGGGHVYIDSAFIELTTLVFRSNQNLTVTSDINLKNILSFAEASIEDIANTRIVNFEFKNNIGKTILGSIAQDWQEIFPNAISVIDKQGHLGMSYESIALASSVIGAREIVKLKEENSELKLRISALEAKLANI